MGVNEKMTAIANAIRGKTGSSGLLSLDDMPSAISSITTASAPYLDTCSTSYQDHTATVGGDEIGKYYVYQLRVGKSDSSSTYTYNVKLKSGGTYEFGQSGTSFTTVSGGSTILTGESPTGNGCVQYAMFMIRRIA